MGFLQGFERCGFALSQLAGEASGNCDGFAETFNFSLQRCRVVRAFLEDGEFLASFGKLVFQDEIPVLGRLIRFIGACVEAADRILRLLQFGFGSEAAFRVCGEGLAECLEFCGGRIQSGLGD